MTLPIYVYGSDVLREKAVEVDLAKEGIPEEMKKLVEDMWETMDKADGIGLAAPQVGKSVRVLVVDGTLLADDYEYLKDFKRVMINPVVEEESDDTSEYNEGCLSVPDIHADIIRPKKITVSYFDENLEQKREVLDNFACRMVQHEMDHLDGILFVDRATPIRKKMISGKLNNIKTGKIKTHYRIAK